MPWGDGSEQGGRGKPPHRVDCPVFRATASPPRGPPGVKECGDHPF
jgi:hypothetical protein